ncbi:hypothetical protein C4573_01335 [Candidatus Woesearchaeota archaeon]|nr:MAG: hypothetical protein C4573_01335 [Candidatus Woesearchaeota archaeon]
MSLISTFESIRDIPYRIPLKWGEEDDCCSGKHEKLFNLLKKNGYEVRYRVCVFLWSNLNLPPELEKIPHDNDCTHTYLEIKIDSDWKILDATWDAGLKGIFHINKWDGKSDTEIAVKPTKIFTPEKSLEIVNNQNEELINKDLKINGKFYNGFNEWLDKNRK